MGGPLLFVSAIFLRRHPIRTTQRRDVIIFSTARADKNSIKHEPRISLLHTEVGTFVLMYCLDDVTFSYHQLSLLNSAIFELTNGGQSYREFVVQKVGLLVKLMA